MKKFGFVALFALTGCMGLVDSTVNEDLGNGYTCQEFNGFPVIIKFNPAKGIPAIVRLYKFNSKFITASQIDYEICDKSLGKNYEYDDCWKIILKNKPKFNYWIIVKDDDSIFGPLSYEKYLSMSRSMSIPENLKLE